MGKDSIVFPQELELVMDIVNSPVLEGCTRVSDENTCGVAVARVFNMVQVSGLQMCSTKLFKDIIFLLDIPSASSLKDT